MDCSNVHRWIRPVLPPEAAVHGGATVATPVGQHRGRFLPSLLRLNAGKHPQAARKERK